VGFATMGLQKVLCPDGADTNMYERLGNDDRECFSHSRAL
jgi:hypothetical protein